MTDSDMTGDGGHRLFRDLTGSGAGSVDWGRLVWLADRETAGAEVTIGYVEVAPFRANPVHRHNTCTEMIFLLEGEIDHSVGEESVRMKAGDLLVVPPGLAHGATNPGSAEARMMVVYDTGERDFEAVT